MEKEIIEGNKLIAEFMGEKTCYVGNIVCIDKGRGFTYPVDEWAKYHSSWDWLHPAWEKFRDLKLSRFDEGWTDHYSRHLVAVSTAIHAYPINIAFERLVRALQWYNKSKINETTTK